MDTTSAVSAANANTYSTTTTSSSSSRKSTETSSVSKTVATDSYTPSGNASASDAKAAKAGWEGFDMTAFQNEMRDKLLQQIRDSQKSLKDAGVKFYGGSSFLYDLSGADTGSYTDEQMGVGKDWGAEATSERIVNFALAFRGSGSAKGLSDEEFVAKIRDAITKGFGLAKGDLGDVPGPTGKLFNDTYQATMDKLDKALEDMQKASGSTTNSPSSSAVAASSSTATRTSNTSSTYSVLA